MSNCDRFQAIHAIKGISSLIACRHPEVVILTCYAIIVYCISMIINTKFSFPCLNNSIFIGIHYLTALILGGIGSVFGIVFTVNLPNKKSGCTIIGILVEYLSFIIIFIICMWLHFHIKMWIPLINSYQFDDIYYRSDHLLNPIIEQFMEIRGLLSQSISNIDCLYTYLFIMMFVISFFFHSVWDRQNIRRLFLASLLVQAFGSLSYLIMPAVGPFIYEDGLSTLATRCQSGMWAAYQALRTQGPSWLDENAPRYFTAGLAAMPSLHAAAAWVFLHFARKSLKYLLVPYVPFFLWIIIEAVASKWHYLIDLPVGVALACACIRLAEKLEDRRERCDTPSPRVLSRHAFTDSNGGRGSKPPT